MRSDVRLELATADIVIPSLDAALVESFLKVDRPGADVNLEEVVAGLTSFSLEYRGKLWLEILFVQGFNDSFRDVEALVSALRPMRLDKIQLNTVVRPPAVPFARPVGQERLIEIADYFYEKLAVPVDLPFVRAEEVSQEQPSEVLKTKRTLSLDEALEEILQMLKRRPCTAVDIDRTFQLGGPEKVEQLLEPLVNSGALQRQDHGNTSYYQ